MPTPTTSNMEPKPKVDYCLARGCGSNSRDHPQLRFHPFPKEGMTHLYVTNKSDLAVKMDRKKIWEMILLLKNPATPLHRVCSLHFQSSDYYKHDCSPLAQLCKTTIPTLNLPQEHQEKVQVCMVNHCSNHSDGNNGVNFFTESTVNNLRWILWRKALGILRGPQQIVVCSDHFVQGCPSGNPEDVDFTPTLRVGDYWYGIERVNVSDSYLTERDEECTEDPLKLGGSEFAIPEPEFVSVQDLPVKEEFPDFDEILQSIKVEPTELDRLQCIGDHSYSK